MERGRHGGAVGTTAPEGHGARLERQQRQQRWQRRQPQERHNLRRRRPHARQQQPQRSSVIAHDRPTASRERRGARHAAAHRSRSDERSARGRSRRGAARRACARGLRRAAPTRPALGSVRARSAIARVNENSSATLCAASAWRRESCRCKPPRHGSSPPLSPATTPSAKRPRDSVCDMPHDSSDVDRAAARPRRDPDKDAIDDAAAVAAHSAAAAAASAAESAAAADPAAAAAAAADRAETDAARAAAVAAAADAAAAAAAERAAAAAKYAVVGVQVERNPFLLCRATGTDSASRLLGDAAERKVFRTPEGGGARCDRCNHGERSACPASRSTPLEEAERASNGCLGDLWPRRASQRLAASVGAAE